MDHRADSHTSVDIIRRLGFPDSDTKGHETAPRRVTARGKDSPPDSRVTGTGTSSPQERPPPGMWVGQNGNTFVPFNPPDPEHGMWIGRTFIPYVPVPDLRLSGPSSNHQPSDTHISTRPGTGTTPDGNDPPPPYSSNNPTDSAPQYEGKG
jgi:hypothetical protein